MRHRAAAGFTILELAVVLTVCAVAWSMAQPRYGVVVEAARRDDARGRLTAVWRAQRVYRLRHGTFATSVAALLDDRLLEADLLGTAGPFRYEVERADSQSFEARATRRGSAVWEGHLAVDQRGAITDRIEPPL